MRIGVIGAGAIGGTIAALLDRVGHLVEVTARGEQLAAIRDGGLRLDGGWGSHTAQIAAAETLQTRPELAFVTTKAQDAPAAIRANAAVLDGITVVVVQNGLAGLREAEQLLPESDCVGALALYAASYLSPGLVSVTTTANTYLGAGDGPPPPAAVDAARILDAAMPAFAIDNFTGAQWTKLMVNQINALPAITGLSAQQVLGDRRLRAVVTASLQEATRVGYARGVRYGSIQGLDDRILRVVARAPRWAAQAVPLLMKRRMGSTPNPGSTLQSIRRGQLTEIDYLNGAVVDEARTAGIEAPVNAAITALVHEVERTGTFLTPDQVDERMRPLLA
ncbi:ketopantoate reductase family protein [Leifsonia sp. 21MFCrub1.1]|uniref:ketopantoate reductase family protein n=1 Tax=Leifsonia sp. 21MFCrub1.1 TaxID=1798223 RepID=UPI0008928AD0|nr:2-dehydropantoate 2-reductase [Leifsonia sp. 21MFCrub1.1]SEA95499.1 ketopantoate reductase [Leifsonia sp. 21MFCrub1.1]